MPDIKDSVGTGGVNKIHDVALVQAMLTVLKDAKGAVYLKDYNGQLDASTTAAITNFQADQKIPTYKAGTAPPPAGAEKEGFVAAGSTTLAKIVASLPAGFGDICIIENTNTVYFAGSQADADNRVAKITAYELDATFRLQVIQLVRQMFQNYKIVLFANPGDTRRSFEQQANINPPNTKAGPGESNHNYGKAIDLYFHFQWLKGEGNKSVLPDYDLQQLKTADPAKEKAIWETRDTVAHSLKPPLYNTTLKGDQGHLQAYDDHATNYQRSLADLLNRVGKLKWSAGGGQYQSDFGLGGKLYNVGTATKIWNLNAQIAAVDYADAKTAAAQKAGLKSGGPKALAAVKPVQVTDIKATDIADLQKQLKADFEAADNNWTKWKPL